ncbi:Avr9/Cf-9 rapidly elicited protein, partial [Trifolium medium]|nr:Avr9/Cf-9 rapidly elicited protein [Trifolium medium]
MPMDFAPGGGEIEKMMNGNNDRVLKLAPPSTVGGVG